MVGRRRDGADDRLGTRPLAALLLLLPLARGGGGRWSRGRLGLGLDRLAVGGLRLRLGRPAPLTAPEQHAEQAAGRAGRRGVAPSAATGGPAARLHLLRALLAQLLARRPRLRLAGLPGRRQPARPAPGVQVG